MKFTYLFFTLLLAGVFSANAEEPVVVGEPMSGGLVLAATTAITDIVQFGDTADEKKGCSCRCSAQGILLLECEGRTENLGHFGNIANCNIHKEKHPQCN